MQLVAAFHEPSARTGSSSHEMLFFKKASEKEKEKTQEVTESRAAAKEISMDTGGKLSQWKRNKEQR